MQSLRRRFFPLLLGLLPVLLLADALATVVAGYALSVAGSMAVGLALALLAALAARPHGPRAMVAGFAAFALAGALLAYWPFGNLKRLHRAAASVQVGMTRAEVAGQLRSRLELSPDPFPYSAQELDLWYGDGAGLVECRVAYDPSDRVARVETRFETGWSDFSTVVAAPRD
jgi:hypothetical protein